MQGESRDPPIKGSSGGGGAPRFLPMCEKMCSIVAGTPLSRRGVGAACLLSPVGAAAGWTQRTSGGTDTPITAHKTARAQLNAAAGADKATQQTALLPSLLHNISLGGGGSRVKHMGGSNKNSSEFKDHPGSQTEQIKFSWIQKEYGNIKGPI